MRVDRSLGGFSAGGQLKDQMTGSALCPFSFQAKEVGFALMIFRMPFGLPVKDFRVDVFPQTTKDLLATHVLIRAHEHCLFPSIDFKKHLLYRLRRLRQADGSALAKAKTFHSCLSLTEKFSDK